MKQEEFGDYCAKLRTADAETLVLMKIPTPSSNSQLLGIVNALKNRSHTTATRQLAINFVGVCAMNYMKAALPE